MFNYNYRVPKWITVNRQYVPTANQSIPIFNFWNISPDPAVITYEKPAVLQTTKKTVTNPILELMEEPVTEDISEIESSTVVNTETPEEETIQQAEEPPVQKVEEKPAQVSKKIRFLGQNIDLDKALSVLHYNLNKPHRGLCTRHVALALKGINNANTASGIKNPQDLYQKLLKSGWTDIYSNDYVPQKGDVYTIWNVKLPDGDHMHSSMYDGKHWISYGIENKTGNKPWLYTHKNDPGIQIHIMRYLK